LTVWPAAVTVVGEAVLVSESAGFAVAVRVALEGAEVTAAPVGGVPDAVAVLLTDPASISAWVTVYVAVHVTCAPGAIELAPAGHVAALNDPVPENAPSFTPTPCNVTFPVFVTTNEYVTPWPAADTLVGNTDFDTLNPGAAAAVNTTVDAADVSVAPDGSFAETVAVFDTDPASTSACVTRYVAVHVTCAPGAIDAAPAGHDTADNDPDPVNTPSCTTAFVNVTLPVFVIKNEYVTVCNAADTLVGDTDFFTVNPGDWVAVNTTVDDPDVTAPPLGFFPAADAVFDTEPASISACVTVYVAVHVTLTPGAIDAAPAGQLTADNDPEPVNAPSFTPTPCTVWFPEFVTTNEYVTDWPAADTLVGNTDFTIVNPGPALTATVADDGAEVWLVPPGSLADAVAVFVTDPASISAWVIV
jgi:hypothetical protein